MLAFSEIELVIHLRVFSQVKFFNGFSIGFLIELAEIAFGFTSNL